MVTEKEYGDELLLSLPSASHPRGSLLKLLHHVL